MIRFFFILTACIFIFGEAAVALALEPGDKAPDFTAQGVDGAEHSLDSLSKKSEVVVICFTCNQCPIAMAYEDRLVEFNKKFPGKDVSFIALNCNTATEGLEAMKQRAEEKSFNFLYAFDESGEAARAYGAKVTPELFVVKDGKVAYHGAFDDALNDPAKHYVADAVTALLNGKTPDPAQTKAFGCGIKVAR